MTSRPQHRRRPEPAMLAPPGHAGLVVTSPPRLAGAPSLETTRWVRGVLAETVPALAGAPGRVTVLREGRKRLAVLEPDDGPALVLKQYADDRGAWTQRWMQRLVEAEFAPRPGSR